jgi:hypothetical protein
MSSMRWIEMQDLLFKQVVRYELVPFIYIVPDAHVHNLSGAGYHGIMIVKIDHEARVQNHSNTVVNSNLNDTLS